MNTKQIMNSWTVVALLLALMSLVCAALFTYLLGVQTQPAWPWAAAGSMCALTNLLVVGFMRRWARMLSASSPPKE